MFNNLKHLFVLVFFVLLAGCAVAPIQREIDLPDQNLAQSPADDSKARLIMFNNSNKFWFGMDGSGKINVSLDGKGVCRLGIGEFVIVETNPGEHRIDLEHRDMALFKSSHTINAAEGNNFIQVFATPASNVAEITPKPDSFENAYSAVKF